VWQKLFGGINREDPAAIVAHPDSGYLVLSSFQSKPNFSNLWLLRLNNKGDTVWTKCYGDSTKNELPIALHIIPEGYMIIGALHGSTSDRSLWLIKCKGNGDIIWSKTFKNKNVFGSICTNDSSVVITGQAEKKLFMMKVDSIGDSLFCNYYSDTSEMAIGYSVIQTNDRGFAITGQNKTNKNKASILLLKLDYKGDTLWTKKYGNETGDIGNDLLQLSDGSMILAGSRVTTTSGNPKSYLQLISPQGKTVWEKCFGNDSCSANIQRVLITKNDMICALGTKLESKGSEIILLMYNLHGELLFSKEFGNFTNGQQTNFFRDFTISSEGNFIIAAYTHPVNGGQAFIFEVNSKFDETSIKQNIVISKQTLQKSAYYNLLGQQLSSHFGQKSINYLLTLKRNGSKSALTILNVQ
jgi:hypothetical protein